MHSATSVVRAIRPGANRAERPTEEPRSLPDVRCRREKRISIYGEPGPGAAVTRFGDGPGAPGLLPFADGPGAPGLPRYVTDTARRYSGLVTVARGEAAFARASGLCRNGIATVPRFHGIEAAFARASGLCSRRAR